MDDDGWVNDHYMNRVVLDTTLISHVIGHFCKCLQRQCIFEDVLGAPNSLKKHTALPEFHIHRISIQIDKQGLYYIMKQHMKDYKTNWDFKSSKNTFKQPQFKKWFKKLFYIGGLIGKTSPSKEFNWTGVAITTDGVKASLHYDRRINVLSTQVEVINVADNIVEQLPDDMLSAGSGSDNGDGDGGDTLTAMELDDDDEEEEEEEGVEDGLFVGGGSGGDITTVPTFNKEDDSIEMEDEHNEMINNLAEMMEGQMIMENIDMFEDDDGDENEQPR